MKRFNYVSYSATAKPLKSRTDYKVNIIEASQQYEAGKKLGL